MRDEGRWTISLCDDCAGVLPDACVCEWTPNAGEPGSSIVEVVPADEVQRLRDLIGDLYMQRGESRQHLVRTIRRTFHESRSRRENTTQGPET